MSSETKEEQMREYKAGEPVWVKTEAENWNEEDSPVDTAGDLSLGGHCGYTHVSNARHADEVLDLTKLEPVPVKQEHNGRYVLVRLKIDDRDVKHGPYVHFNTPFPSIGERNFVSVHRSNIVAILPEPEQEETVTITRAAYNELLAAVKKLEGK